MVSNILETCLWEVIGICASLISHTRESNQVCLNVRFLIKHKETILVFLLNVLKQFVGCGYQCIRHTYTAPTTFILILCPPHWAGNSLSALSIQLLSVRIHLRLTSVAVDGFAHFLNLLAFQLYW